MVAQFFWFKEIKKFDTDRKKKNIIFWELCGNLSSSDHN